MNKAVREKKQVFSYICLFGCCFLFVGVLYKSGKFIK